MRSRDIMLVCELYDGRGLRAAEAFVIVAARKQFAHHAQRVLLAQLERLPGHAGRGAHGEVAYEGQRYKFKRRVEPDVPLLGPGKHGARPPFNASIGLAGLERGICFLDSDKWAHYVIHDMAAGCCEGDCATRIVVQRLEHRSGAFANPNRLDEYHVTQPVGEIAEVFLGGDDSEDDVAPTSAKGGCKWESLFLFSKKKDDGRIASHKVKASICLFRIRVFFRIACFPLLFCILEND